MFTRVMDSLFLTRHKLSLSPADLVNEPKNEGMFPKANKEWRRPLPSRTV